MAFIKPDFTEVAESIVPGEYKVRVKDAQLKEWAAREDRPARPYIRWELETFGDEKKQNNGRRIWHNTDIAGKAAFRLKDFLSAALKETVTGQFDTEAVMGKEVLVTVVESKGKDGMPNGYTEVKTVRPLA